VHGKRLLLSEPSVQALVVEHRDRLGRFDAEYLEAALSARVANSW
jgi:predicted site-specific integrase-resolvase